MSYDSKIAQVKGLVDTHNSNVDDSSKVDFDKFMDNLRNLGGTSELALKSVSWEDLQDAGLPKIIARTAASIFRQENGDSGSKSGWISEKKAHQMTVKELLDRYDPSEPDTHVAKRLQVLSKGKKCIVFDRNGKICVEVSSNLIEDLKQGLPELQTTLVEGFPTPIYPIGVKPDQYFDENPLFPGRILRNGQICDQTNRSWDGVNSVIRQLLWIALTKTRELKISNCLDAHDILDKILITKDWDEKIVRQRFVKASQMYDEMEKTGSLPTLKVSVSAYVLSNPSSNNPFGNPRRF